VIQRLVKYSLSLSKSESEVELRFFDTSTEDFGKSSIFEYVVCRMSPEEAHRLAGDLTIWAIKAAGDPHKQPRPCNNADSWRNW
jgi:hypothetical protein